MDIRNLPIWDRDIEESISQIPKDKREWLKNTTEHLAIIINSDMPQRHKNVIRDWLFIAMQRGQELMAETNETF